MEIQSIGAQAVKIKNGLLDGGRIDGTQNVKTKNENFRQLKQ